MKELHNRRSAKNKKFPHENDFPFDPYDFPFTKEDILKNVSVVFVHTRIKLGPKTTVDPIDCCDWSTLL